MKQLVSAPKLRSSLGVHAHKVTWLELFFDLIFVAAVAQVAEPLREHYTFGEITRLAPLFVLIWWAWTGHTLFSTRFSTDDTTQRILTLLQMFCVAAMAANAKDALDSRSSAGFAAAYAAMRFLLVAQYVGARQVPAARPLATRYVLGHGTAAIVWMISALVPAPLRFALWAAAFAIDLSTPWLVINHSVKLPPDAAHLPERFGLFMLILLGDAVIAVMQGMESQEHWPAAAAVSAFLSMAIVFILWWWYFDGISGASAQAVHNRRDALRFHIWCYAHFPLYLGVVVVGVGLRRIVGAASQSSLDTGEAFILATAAAVVMIAMTVIGQTAGGRGDERPRDWIPHVFVAAATVSYIVIAQITSPLALAVALTALVTAQLCASLSRPRRANDEKFMEALS